MHTAVLAGLVVGVLTAWFSLPCAQSNADFIYICAAAASLDDWHLLVTPYFPPGYPILIWLAVKASLPALTAGMLCSAFGAALSAGSLAYLARLFKLPAAIALGVALLGASLPDVFQIAFNPHLDALYTGLAMVFIACAFRLMADKPHIASTVVFALCGALLLALRYHAVLVVIAIALAVLVNRRAASRKAALVMLAGAAVVLGWVYWAQYATYGGFESASMAQIATGRTYRALGEPAAAVIFQDYASWLATVAPVETSDIIAGVAANWPTFLTRKAVLLGFGMLVLVLALTRRWPPGAPLLLAFIVLYTLAVSPTYFTPRASALTELLSLALAASALGMLVPWIAANKPRGEPSPKLDPALTGLALVVFCISGVSYNLWREHYFIVEWRNRRAEVVAVNNAALGMAGGERRLVYGSMDHNAWSHDKPYNLPGATYSRYWMDDPLVVPLVEPLIPKYSAANVLSGSAPVNVVVLWPQRGSPLEKELALNLEGSSVWAESESPVVQARIWVRQ